jgi:hypothetical protein
LKSSTKTNVKTKSNTSKATNTNGKAIIACNNIIAVVLKYCLVKRFADLRWAGISEHFSVVSTTLK